MLGPCWVISWAVWGSMEVSGTKNSTPTEKFWVDVHFGGTWRAMLGRFGPMFGPMLGHFVGYVGFHGGLWNEDFNPNRKLLALGGLCWAHIGSFRGLCGVLWRSLERKIQPQPKNFGLRLILGSLGRLCWAVLGLCWAYVGPMLGPCWVISWAVWGSMEVSGTKNSHFGGS